MSIFICVCMCALCGACVQYSRSYLCVLCGQIFIGVLTQLGLVMMAKAWHTAAAAAAAAAYHHHKIDRNRDASLSRWRQHTVRLRCVWPISRNRSPGHCHTKEELILQASQPARSIACCAFDDIHTRIYRYNMYREKQAVARTYTLYTRNTIQQMH